MHCFNASPLLLNYPIIVSDEGGKSGGGGGRGAVVGGRVGGVRGRNLSPYVSGVVVVVGGGEGVQIFTGHRNAKHGPDTTC